MLQKKLLSLSVIHKSFTCSGAREFIDGGTGVFVMVEKFKFYKFRFYISLF